MRKKLELNWQGKEYSLLVTMEVIDRVEDKINVGRLLAQQTTGDIRFSHTAKFIAILLNEAGANVTQEDVYSGMFSGGDITPENMIPFMNNIFTAFFPEQKKKEPVKRKTTAKKKARATHGKASIK